jgi:hypothetical protein
VPSGTLDNYAVKKKQSCHARWKGDLLGRIDWIHSVKVGRQLSGRPIICDETLANSQPP